MSAGVQLEPAAVRLLEEAAEWRLYGLLFEYPTDQWRANMESLLPSLEPTGLRGVAEAALEHATEGLHIALFGPAGTVPVREVTYRGGVQFGYLMAELSAYYEAFGYEPEVTEASDHLAVQLGFVAFLKLKQAYAEMEGDSEKASLTEAAIKEFLREHIATQAEPVTQRMAEFGPEYLENALKLVVAHVGPSPRSLYPLAAATTEFGDCDSEQMSCGTPGSDDTLVQLEP